jgi:hypothetical protein
VQIGVYGEFVRKAGISRDGNVPRLASDLSMQAVLLIGYAADRERAELGASERPLMCCGEISGSALPSQPWNACPERVALRLSCVKARRSGALIRLRALSTTSLGIPLRDASGDARPIGLPNATDRFLMSDSRRGAAMLVQWNRGWRPTMIAITSWLALGAHKWSSAGIDG